MQNVLIPEAPAAMVKQAFADARERKARLTFLCDTRDQADVIATEAATALPEHLRLPYEMAEAGQYAPLVRH
jgi:hypothetical protein